MDSTLTITAGSVGSNPTLNQFFRFVNDDIRRYNMINSSISAIAKFIFVNFIFAAKSRLSTESEKRQSAEEHAQECETHLQDLEKQASEVTPGVYLNTYS